MSRKKRRRKSKAHPKPSVPEISGDFSEDVPLEGKDQFLEEASDTSEINSDDPRVTEDEPRVRLPGFFAGTLELPKDRAPWPIVVFLILVAYALSVHVRMSWIEMAMGTYCPAHLENVASISITTAGTGYVVNEVVTISGGGGAGATAKVSSVGGRGEITGVTLTAAGSGYTTTPNAKITNSQGESGVLAVHLLCGSMLQENDLKCSNCGTKRGRESMRWEGHPTPNTHDSFYFAAILQKAHLGMHQENDMVPSVVQNGMVTVLSYGLLKTFSSLSIEELLLWMPVYLSGLVCVPIVLIGRLYGSVVWGFFAACIAGVAHSYFNRTLAGYYDTDVFSVSAAAFALLFLLIALRRRSLAFALAGAVGCFLYPFFYNRIGIPIALGLTFVGFQLFQAFSVSFSRSDKGSERWFHLAGYAMVSLYFAWFFGFEGVFGGKGGSLLAFVVLLVAVLAPIAQRWREKASEQEVSARERGEIVGFAWRSAILVGVGTASCAFAGGKSLQLSVTPFFLVLAALVVLYLLFSRISIGERVLAGVGSAALLYWAWTANPLQVVFQKAESYVEAKQASSSDGKST